MSNRGGRGGRGGGRANNVRGPTSALTEFLREQGISARNTNIYARRIQTSDEVPAIAEEPATEAGPSAAEPDSPGEAQPTSSSRPAAGKRRRNKNDDSDLESDNLDATDDEAEQPATKSKGKGKTQQSKKELEKAKAKAKAKHDAKRQKQDDEEPSEDEYKAPSKGLPVVPTSLPPIGSFEKCVTRYTMAADPPPGFLCHTCAKASGGDPFKKAGAPRGRKPVAEKRKIVNFEQKDVFKSLATTCIEIIAKYIDDMEALGDIGHINMDKISKILAKQRSLTDSTSKLFYSVENTTLTLYDTSRLDPPAFHTLIALNPNLEQVRLDYCHLYGAFLARAQPSSNSSLRLALASSASDWHIRPDWTLTVAKRWRRCFLTSEPVVELLGAIGRGLEHLDLSGHPLLEDEVLINGVISHAPNLTSLAISSAPLLTDAGVAQFFAEYNQKAGLEYLEMKNNPLLSSDSLVRSWIAHIYSYPAACDQRLEGDRRRGVQTDS
ncbi:RNI-like protein [Rhizoctonia solani]|uniref:RNI-like protein n=1 Tax=Rhizoctonia solani TaxID=456999 RepID=A0A8H7LZA8_9AGAM|nr:RNI-like protein [Rhizoctonia solani]